MTGATYVSRTSSKVHPETASTQSLCWKCKDSFPMIGSPCQTVGLARADNQKMMLCASSKAAVHWLAVHWLAMHWLGGGRPLKPPVRANLPNSLDLDNITRSVALQAAGTVRELAVEFIALVPCTQQ